MVGLGARRVVVSRERADALTAPGGAAHFLRLVHGVGKQTGYRKGRDGFHHCIGGHLRKRGRACADRSWKPLPAWQTLLKANDAGSVLPLGTRNVSRMVFRSPRRGLGHTGHRRCEVTCFQEWHTQNGQPGKLPSFQTAPSSTQHHRYLLGSSALCPCP